MTRKSGILHDDCVSYDSVNKFRKNTVGAVRRAANQNPTIAGGNRTITLSAISRPKHNESEQLVERIPPDGSQKSLLRLPKVPPAGGGCGGDTYNKCQSG